MSPGPSCMSLPSAKMERRTGIEPASAVWKTAALPLSYLRISAPAVARCHAVPESVQPVPVAYGWSDFISLAQQENSSTSTVVEQ